ncbi:NADP-dependent aldehyde dehydrogenase [Labrenzia sp. EL_159]|nr:NADP-dependent aldehyde dehydrogenase [Labrenzia sp. EL_162]MBG6198759.1 NADP-dependent aldehyde dehydrogenase [Labrenzia sp. EL_159]
MLTGKNLVNGEWVSGETTFQSQPAEGPSSVFSEASVSDVDRACEAAEKAFEVFGSTSDEQRAALLHKIADEIEARGAELTEIGSRETALPAARLEGERGRTAGQLRLFAETILKGDYLDKRHDEALPDRAPLPRPELFLVQRPIGPVAVFGASNFPLAFSTAGGDTASALAAGCPVVVKGHPAHPGTGEIVAQAIDAAVKACGMPAGTFGFLQGTTHELGQQLVQHPLVKAVGFTGSLRGGRALFDLCAARSEPIPFFGELGSVNPVFLLPSAMEQRAEAIGEGWAGSLTMGVGQFCTNPGIVVVREGEEVDRFADAAVKALQGVGAQTMLTGGIAAACRSGQDRLAKTEGVETLLKTQSESQAATPSVYQTNAGVFLANHALQEEVFGPVGLIVTVADDDEMRTVAACFDGQLTATLHLEANDNALAKTLLPILERRAGRVLANGFPTGVEVAETMVHGGPYPASTNFGATSVGTMAIRRWLRPVCYQNLPAELLH